MNLIAQTAVLAAETDHHGNIMAETFIFGVISLVVFSALAFVTFSYKNVANRHSAKAEAWAARNGGHEAGHGH